MMKIFIKFMCIALILPGLVGCKEEPKTSMNDGFILDGVVMPLSAIRNITATRMILNCMKSGVDRYSCQCYVDNAFKDMDADEFLAFLKDDSAKIGDIIKTMQKYCADDPKGKIPPTDRPGGMIGGEIHTFIKKEIMLDCVMTDGSEKSCECYADGFEKLLSDGGQLRNILKIIDARKDDMAKYRPDNIAMEIKRLRKKCGLK